jgi:acyl carrier protein
MKSEVLEMDDVERRVGKVVVDHLRINENGVKNESSDIDDLSVDPLDTVELMMASEEEFDMEIPEDATENITTVEDAINYVSDHDRS